MTVRTLVVGACLCCVGVQTSAKPSNQIPHANATQPSLSEPPLLQTSIETDNARSLFLSSGLQELVEKIPTSTASSFEDALTVDRLPDIFLDIDEGLIRDAVRDAFKFETFDNYMLKQLRHGMDNPAREQMLSWYETDLGLRVRQAEIKNSLLTEQKRFEEFQVYLKRYPTTMKRDHLIRQLDDTMNSTDSAVDMMINIQIAFNLSLSRFLPEEQRFTRQELMDMVNEDEQALLAYYRQQTIDVLLFTYQELNDEELSRLDATLSTNAGQAFVAAINDGIKKAMFAASLDLGDGLGELLENNTRGPGI